MSTHQPLVSVCIASYNHAEYVGQAIDSILEQTYRNLEIIIVDDGSSDDSLEILNSYAARFPDRIQVFTHPNRENRGISITTNLAIEKSNGKYIALIGSDDIWEKNKLELQIPLLEQNPRVGIVYSKGITMNNRGKIIGSIIGAGFKSKPDQLAQIAIKNVIPAPTAVFRRECVDRLGGFDERLVCSDWELWLRILAHWEMAFVDKPLIRYRVHRRNTSIGIGVETNVERLSAVFASISEKKEKIGGKLLNPEIQRIIQNKPAEIRKEMYLAHLDNYFINCQYENFQSALPHLIAALKSAPLKMIKPRRLASIGKHFLLSLKRKPAINSSH